MVTVKKVDFLNEGCDCFVLSSIIQNLKSFNFCGGFLFKLSMFCNEKRRLKFSKRIKREARGGEFVNFVIEFFVFSTSLGYSVQIFCYFSIQKAAKSFKFCCFSISLDIIDKHPHYTTNKDLPYKNLIKLYCP